MKCFIISISAEIIYSWYDADFQVLLAQSVNDCAELNNAEFDFTTHALDVFSFLTAYDTLLSLNNECYSFITCKNGFKICFQKYDQFLYVGLAQTKDDQNDKIFRELGFIRKSILFLFGPGGHAIFRTHDCKQKKKALKCIDAMLESYMNLCETENAFLLEGIEQIQQLNDRVFGYEEQIEKCINSFIKPPLSKHLQYVMIFVGSKILCFHKLSPQIANLNTRTFLLIIALIHSTIHYTNTKINATASEKLLSEHDFQDGHTDLTADKQLVSVQEDVLLETDLSADNQSVLVEEDMFSKVDGDCLFDNTDVMSLASTVTAFGAQSLVSLTDSNFCTHSQFCNHNIVDDSAIFSDNSRAAFTIHKPFNPISDYFSLEKSNLVASQTVPVFLATNQSPSVPCQLSFIPLNQSRSRNQGASNEESCPIKMVIIFKAKCAAVADPICAMWFWLRHLRFITENEIWPTEVKAKELDEKLSKCFDQVFKKTKGLDKSIKETGAKLKANWQNQAQKDVISTLKSKNLKMLTTIKRFISITESHLIKLHDKLYPSFIASFSRLLSETALSQIQVSVRNELLCYMDYLLFKSQQNISITPYLNCYPGLVHFAVVQRTILPQSLLQPNTKYHDIVFSPSISEESILSGIGQALLSTLHREYLIFLQLVSNRLLDGQLNSVYTQKGFKFVSCVKCADYVLDDWVSKKSVVSPSLFSSNFYENCFCVSSEADPCSFVYQLITVHFDCVSNETIMHHRDKLFAVLLKNLHDSSVQ